MTQLTRPFGTVFLAVAVFCGSSATQAAPQLTIQNITVIDPIDGVVNRRDVVIEGDRIVRVAAARPEAKRSANSPMIDGTGKYLIPGLWDMHGHVSDRASGPLYVLNGVTGVRQMQGHSQSYVWRHQEIEATPAMPRMYLGSTLIDGSPAHVPGSIEVSSPEDARKAVRTVKRSGAEFLKVYSKVPAPAYAALMDEAQKLGVRVEGHVPDSVSWLTVAADGKQRSIEHLWGLPRWVASNAEDLSKRTAEFYDKVTWGGTLTAEQRKRSTELQNEAYDNYDHTRFAALVAVLARNRVWQSPTLVMWETRTRENDTKTSADPRLVYLPQWMREFWTWKVANDRNGEPAAKALAERRHRFNMDRLREMHAAGVPILAGTDSPLPYVLPGWSLHEEMELLVQAGLSPTEALRTATSNAGTFIGREDIGRIRVGAIADLVILTADPLRNIKNSREIETVIIAGRPINKSAREAALEQFKRQFAAPTVGKAMIEAFKKNGFDAAIATYERQCPAAAETLDCTPIDAVEYSLAPALSESAAKDRLGDLVNWAEQRFAADVEIQTWAALQHKKSGRADKAKAAFAQALALAPGSPFLLHHLEKF